MGKSSKLQFVKFTITENSFYCLLEPNPKNGKKKKSQVLETEKMTKKNNLDSVTDIETVIMCPNMLSHVPVSKRTRFFALLGRSFLVRFGRSGQLLGRVVTCFEQDTVTQWKCPKEHELDCHLKMTRDREMWKYCCVVCSMRMFKI